MKIKNTLSILLIALFWSCASEESDDDKLVASARQYFFLDDSVDVSVRILDTLHTDELGSMLETITENQRLIQLDIDTLGSMIDELAYKDSSEVPSNQAKTYYQVAYEQSDEKIKLLEYELKYEQLLAKKLEFVQNERVFLGLKRAAWADVAGFNVEVSFENEGAENSLLVLMDGNYRIVD